MNFREISRADWSWATGGIATLVVLYKENRGAYSPNRYSDFHPALYFDKQRQLLYRIKNRRIFEYRLEDVLDLLDAQVEDAPVEGSNN